MPRSREAFKSDLQIQNIHHTQFAAVSVRPLFHAGPLIRDVTRCAPLVADVYRPQPRFCGSPFAHAEKNWPPRRLQRIAHRRIRFLRIALPGVAPVILQIIDAPLRIHQRVLIFVSHAARTLRASFFPGVGINSKFQPFRVNVIGERLHPGREARRIRHNISVPIPAHLPAIVNHDIFIPGIFHPARDHSVRHGLDQIFADVAAKLVPAVPPHRGSQRHSVIPRSRFSRGEKNRSQACDPAQRASAPFRSCHCVSSGSENATEMLRRLSGARPILFTLSMRTRCVLSIGALFSAIHFLAAR